MKAQNYKRVLATVRKQAVAVLGVTTVYVDSFGNECALFAPDETTLREMWRRMTSREFSKRYMQRAAFFRQTKLTTKKRLPNTSTEQS